MKKMTDNPYMTMEEREKNGIKTPWRFWLVGLPGTAKSTSAAWLANAGYKVYIMDMNGESYAGIQAFLTPEGKKNIICIPIYAENLDKKGSKAEEGSVFSQMSAHFEKLHELKELDDPDTFVYADCLTDWSRDVLRTQHQITKGGDSNTMMTTLLSDSEWIRQYGKVLQWTKKCSFVMIGHLTQIDLPMQPTQFGLDYISKAYNVKILNSGGIANLFVFKSETNKQNETTFKVVTRPQFKLPFVKNSLSMTDMPGECDTEWFLPSFLKCAETGVWESGIKEK